MITISKNSEMALINQIKHMSKEGLKIQANVMNKLFIEIKAEFFSKTWERDGHSCTGCIENSKYTRWKKNLSITCYS